VGILTAVQQAARELAPGVRVRRARVGAIYAAVQLDNGFAGVAYRFPAGSGCPRAEGAPWNPGRRVLDDRWMGREARELVERLGEADPVPSALALAAVNALAAGELSSAAASGAAAGAPSPLPGDVLDHLELRDGDRVCMVGCFLPLLRRLENRDIEVLAVDERPRAGTLPAEDVAGILPGSQVALVTATSLVNATLDGLLELASSCRAVALLGPSTPMLARAFAATPVKLLSGIQILDPEPVLQIAAGGGGFRDFRAHVRKINLAV
jgi:uncharacterized protein (DUF4213/DUF364 family)